MKASRGMSDGARVVYMVEPGKPARFGVVPHDRRCRGCRGWATHWWRSGSEHARVNRNILRRKSGGKRGNGMPVCLDCAAYWNSFGRTGKLVEIREAA